MAVRIYQAEKQNPDGSLSVLWPEERPQEWLSKIKSRMPRSLFNAQYNNDPSGLKGVRYDLSWLQYYTRTELPPLSELMGCQGGDPATSESESSNYFGHCTAGRHTSTGIIYILDFQFGHIPATQHLSFLETQYSKWRNQSLPINRVRLETGGPQQATTQHLIADTRQSSNFTMPLEEFKPKGSKEQRIDSVIPFLSNGTVLFPGELLTDGNRTMISHPGFDEFTKEFSQFPKGGRDDVLDSLFIVLDFLTVGSAGVILSDYDTENLPSEMRNYHSKVQRLLEIENELNEFSLLQHEQGVETSRDRIISRSGRRSLIGL